MATAKNKKKVPAETLEEHVGKKVTFNDGENDYKGKISSVGSDGLFRVVTNEDEEFDLERDEFEFAEEEEDDTEEEEDYTVDETSDEEEDDDSIAEHEMEVEAEEYKSTKKVKSKKNKDDDDDADDDKEEEEKPAKKGKIVKKEQKSKKDDEVSAEDIITMHINDVKILIKKEGIKGIPLSTFKNDKKLRTAVLEKMGFEDEAEEFSKEKEIVKTKPKKEKRVLKTAECMDVIVKELKKKALTRKEILSIGKKVASESSASNAFWVILKVCKSLGIMKEKNDTYKIEL